MKGWLLGLAVASVIGVAVLVVVPFRHCPTCDGLTKAVNRAAFKLDCPDCRDRGQVSVTRFLRGSSIDSDLEHLIQARRGTTEVQQDHLGRLEARSGRAPGDSLGRTSFGVLNFEGDFRFVRAEEKDYLLLLLYQEHLPLPGRGVAGIVLVSTGGKILDYIHCTFGTRSGIVVPVFVGNAADGAVACFKGGETHETTREVHRPDLREVYRADVSGSAACPWTALTPPERAQADGIIRVGIRGDRFAFIDAGRR